MRVTLAANVPALSPRIHASAPQVLARRYDAEVAVGWAHLADRYGRSCSHAPRDVRRTLALNERFAIQSARRGNPGNGDHSSRSAWQSTVTRSSFPPVERQRARERIDLRPHVAHPRLALDPVVPPVVEDIRDAVADRTWRPRDPRIAYRHRSEVQLVVRNRQTQDSAGGCLDESKLATTAVDDTQHRCRDSCPRSIGFHRVG